MTIDTVTAFELVKPNGNVVTVTQDSDPSLFFGLKVSTSLSFYWIFTSANAPLV